MSFTNESSRKFSKVFDKSPYVSNSPIVKSTYISKGSNIIFGRDRQNDSSDNLIYIGKVYENTSSSSNYFGSDAWIDITFPHVIYITGTRGSGKSFDLGVLVEGISNLKIDNTIQNRVTKPASILIDTQSQFWTLRYEPKDTIPEHSRQLKSLEKWNLKSTAVSSCKCFLPNRHERIVGDEVYFTLSPSQVSHSEWCELIKEDVYSSQGHILRLTIDGLSHPFSIGDMITYIRTSPNFIHISDSSKNSIIYKLENYQNSGLFDKNGINIADLLKPGQVNIFLLRDLSNTDKSLVTAIISRQLFTIMGDHHKKKKVDRFFEHHQYDSELPDNVWLLIDEAHVIAPSEGSAPARAPLIEYVKRGRDSGLSLALATQQPSAVDDKILSQVNLSFSHRLSFQNDIIAAINRIPTKLLKSLKFNGIEVDNFGDMLRYLETGQCFIGDHSTSRTVLTHIRPRITAHGGYSPN